MHRKQNKKHRSFHMFLALISLTAERLPRSEISYTRVEELSIYERYFLVLCKSCSFYVSHIISSHFHKDLIANYVSLISSRVRLQLSDNLCYLLGMENNNFYFKSRTKESMTGCLKNCCECDYKFPLERKQNGLRHSPFLLDMACK